MSNAKNDRRSTPLETIGAGNSASTGQSDGAPEADAPRSLLGTTYVVRAFGCQMNMSDAERVRGMLEQAGSLPVERYEDADIVVFLTCCVREAADTRLYGTVATMKTMPPRQGSERRVVAVGGCIGQRDGEKLFSKLPNVDVVFGTHTLSRVVELLARVLAGEDRLAALLDADTLGAASTDLPAHRDTDFHAWVPITFGCNNFCTYCIVPYVRGRERSREFDEIVQEVTHLARQGYREVTLLGQNVNSYGRDLYGTPRFSDLLRALGHTGIDRIRFTSSHPKDLSDDTILAMSETPEVMPNLQFAVQSGSSRILKLMHRTYTREQYLQLVDRIRSRMPDIALSTDIIVGFPGETAEDFEQTLSLAERVGFASAFTFIYSRREGTPAASMEDDTPREVIQERFDRLVEVIQSSAYTFNQHELDQVVPVLFESTSKRDVHLVTGHSPKNQTVHAPIPEGHCASEYIGRILPVHVTQARTWYLRGDLLQNEDSRR